LSCIAHYTYAKLRTSLTLYNFVGGSQYRILPLHSQIPREDQRKVFEPVPDGVTKVFSKII